MRSKMMTQYFSNIKSKVNLIIVVRSTIAPEGIIFYTLNGLPTSNQGFKIDIHTSLQPISLNDSYSLLCNKEIMKLVEAT